MLEEVAMKRVLCVFGLMSILAGCGRTSTDGKEIARVTSPDGRVDAIVIEVRTGATVPTPTELYISPKGAKPILDDLVLRGDHFENVSVRWESDKLLELSYSAARIYRFSNFWRSRSIDDSAYLVEIKLRALSVRSLK